MNAVLILCVLASSTGHLPGTVSPAFWTGRGMQCVYDFAAVLSPKRSERERERERASSGWDYLHGMHASCPDELSCAARSQVHDSSVLPLEHAGNRMVHVMWSHWHAWPTPYTPCSPCISRNAA